MSAPDLVATLRASGPHLSVGLLAADPLRLGAALELAEDGDAYLLHVDVMDGRFVPSVLGAPGIVDALTTPMLKDVHLMVDDPLARIEHYVAAGADAITFHAESTPHVHRVLQELGGLTNANDPTRGILRGLALNPGTPASAIEPLLDELELVLVLGVNPGWPGQALIPGTLTKAAEVRRRVDASGRQVLVGFDGGVSARNLAEVAAAGVDIVVAGSAVFSSPAPATTLRAMRATLATSGGAS